MAWEGYRKTRKGRVVYDRKKHPFEWQRASRICWDLVNSDIPVGRRDRYFIRMRAGLLGYSYAMLRMYPEFARQYILGLSKGTADGGSTDKLRESWRTVTLEIVERGLNAFIPSVRGADDVKKFLNFFAGKYYDFLFSLH